jgi:hypothetical protein
MVKALRQFNKKIGRFPDNFAELEENVWKHKMPPDFGPSKSTLTVANYYYVYSRVEPEVCTIWAVPNGPKREEGSTLFMVVAPEVIRRWKGPALDKEEIGKITGTPGQEVLALLGLTEQPLIDQRVNNGSAQRNTTMF